MDIRLDISFLRRDKVMEGFMWKSSRMLGVGVGVGGGSP